MNTEDRKIFLLSPANMNGLRAQQLVSPHSRFALAQSFHSDTMSIGAAFCFVSSLYFRGKLAYGHRFASRRNSSGNSHVFIIAPGFGLVSPDWSLTAERVRTMQRVPVDSREPRYRTPLETHANVLKGMLQESADIILLGSMAHGKYVDVLWPIFGDRLFVPRSFVGIGDMSRGALLLRAALSGDELEYMAAGEVMPQRRARRAQVSR